MVPTLTEEEILSANTWQADPIDGSLIDTGNLGRPNYLPVLNLDLIERILHEITSSG